MIKDVQDTAGVYDSFLGRSDLSPKEHRCMLRALREFSAVTAGWFRTADFSARDQYIQLIAKKASEGHVRHAEIFAAYTKHRITGKV